MDDTNMGQEPMQNQSPGGDMGQGENMQPAGDMGQEKSKSLLGKILSALGLR